MIEIWSCRYINIYIPDFMPIDRILNSSLKFWYGHRRS